MKAIEFEQHNVVFAKDQALKKSRKIWITTATFGTPLQPINMILNS